MLPSTGELHIAGAGPAGGEIDEKPTRPLCNILRPSAAAQAAGKRRLILVHSEADHRTSRHQPGRHMQPTPPARWHRPGVPRIDRRARARAGGRRSDRRAVDRRDDRRRAGLRAGRIVRGDLVMTSEITLSRTCSPPAASRKVLAARRVGVAQVILAEQNESQANDDLGQDSAGRGRRALRVDDRRCSGSGAVAGVTEERLDQRSRLPSVRSGSVRSSSGSRDRPRVARCSSTSGVPVRSVATPAFASSFRTSSWTVSRKTVEHVQT